MASTDLIRDALDAALDQRYPGSSAQPPRCVLVLNAQDDPVARPQTIAGGLEPIGATIEPLSTLDRGVLGAPFPDRAFAGPNGATFAVADWFQEVVDLPAEQIGTAAHDPTDGFRHGPELGWLPLQGRRDLRPGGVLGLTRLVDQPVPSRDLDNAASNPVPRDAVRLRLETEAGTGVGTGVEGGGR